MNSLNLFYVAVLNMTVTEQYQNSRGALASY